MLFGRSFVFRAHRWATLALALQVTRGLGMRDQQQGGSALEHAIQAATQSFRVEGSEALVENNDARPLQQPTRNVKAAALAVGELPAGFAYHLQQPRGHALDQLAQAELAANLFRVLHVTFARRPTASHQQVESERFGQDVVLVELRRRDDAPAPAVHP